MVPRSLPILAPALLALSCVGTSSAFSFDHPHPNSCDSVKITWSGGTAPYSILLTPVFGTPRNISIPSGAYSNDKGSYTIDNLPFPSGQKMLMTMSDATGFGAGGSTGVLKVGSSTSGASCNTTDPGVAFPFELNTALQQCRAYTFSGYDQAVQPITITGIIPNGPTSYDWTVDVYNGTDIVFLVLRRENVGISDDSSCINSASPSVTADPSEDSATATSSATSVPTSAGSTPIGAIAGTVLGALLFLAAVLSFVMFYLKRKQQPGNDKWAGGTDFQRHSRRLQSEVNLVGHYDDQSHGPSPSGSAFPFFPQREYDQTSNSPSYKHPHNMSLSNLSSSNPFSSSQESHVPAVDPFTAGSASSATMSTAQRKAAMAGVSAYTPSRFLLHTDAEDDPLPPPNDDGVVELPPQYTERIAPPPITSASSQDATVPRYAHGPSSSRPS
ncbi:hypothetical protein BDZ89DRAFT_1059114 [Hymenopellis radicata]|nr:hypothetical protein BDZ89DRAFT_1059114 [Hymenopellis radicata]